MTLSQKDTNALKGLGIIMIVLHNVVHQNFGVSENEFSFHQSNLLNFFANFMEYPVTSFFSFLGWIGVSLFVFVSGYGLSSKYTYKIDDKAKWTWKHYLKLVVLLAGGLVLFKLYPLLRDINAIDFKNLFLEFILLLNITAPGDISPMVYWYIGMAFQLYICYLLLRRLSSKILIALIIADGLALAFLPMEYVAYLRHNSPGWLIEFISGILAARYSYDINDKKYRFLLPLLSFMLLILASFSRFTFFLSGPFFIFFAIGLNGFLRRQNILIYLGGISAALYILHSVVRQVFHYLFLNADFSISPLMRGVLVLLVSIIFAIPYQKSYNYICSKIIDKSKPIGLIPSRRRE